MFINFNIEEIMEKKPVKYTLLALLAAFLVKSLVLPTGLNEVLIIGILASLAAFVEYRINNEEIKKVREELAKINVDNRNQDKVIDDIKNSIASVKISSGIRGLTK